MADRFEPDIIHWLSNRLRVDPNGIDLTEYARNRTMYRHREAILHHLGYSAFSPDHQLLLADEAHRLAHLQTRPALMLDALAGYLREHRTVGRCRRDTALLGLADHPDRRAGCLPDGAGSPYRNLFGLLLVTGQRITLRKFNAILY